MSSTTISVDELHKRYAAGQAIDLIDVRTPLEFREVHLPFALNVPFNQLKRSPLIANRQASTANPLYVICQQGVRSQHACKKLLSGGLANAVNVEGGTAAWEQAGLPVVRGEKGFSLERQVRIAAGSLVLIGALLGFYVHPYWLGLSAFVGAGLVVAGVTNTCGMGMILARMPWNHIRFDGVASMDSKGKDVLGSEI